MTNPENPPPEHAPPPVAPGPQPVPPQYHPPASGQPYGPPPYWAPPPAPKRSFWSSGLGVLAIIGIVFGTVILLCVGLVGLGAVSSRNAASKMKVEVTSCSFSGGSLPSATVGYKVTNTGDSANSVRIQIEYRDSSGNRIDTDTARVKSIAPGDTVRGEEITLLDAPASSGTCVITGVS